VTAKIIINKRCGAKETKMPNEVTNNQTFRFYFALNKGNEHLLVTEEQMLDRLSDLPKSVLDDTYSNLRAQGRIEIRGGYPRWVKGNSPMEQIYP
jgi:hypothetical protein